MEGYRLDRYRAAKMFSVNHAAAHDNLMMVAEHIPGVVTGREGKLQTYTFDVARGDPASLAGGLASGFGAAFARLFRGTEYERELTTFRERTLKRLNQRYKRKFTDFDRKFLVVGVEEQLLDEHGERLDAVLTALLQQRAVDATYEHFDGSVETLTLTPYSLVVCKSRLYVVAPKPNGSLYPYRFQRFKAVEATRATFEYPNPTEYDPERLFNDSIGIFVDPEPVTIRVRLTKTWSTYVRYHRFHPSQRTACVNTDGSVEVEFYIRPCVEFEQLILGLGEDAEVLFPISLRDRLSRRLRAALDRYSTE
jgi:predicted DNA-binding transcriptional regulator YafY